jgi:hypothetical protein
MRWDERRDCIGARLADANPGLPSGMVRCVGFRVDGIQHVVRSDEQAADATGLLVGIEELAILIEDLHPMIASIGDEQSTVGVEGEGVRRVSESRF